MDGKYLAEIRERCEADLPDVAAPVFRDRKALLAEVERLGKETATLKRALELACRYHRFDDFKTVRSEIEFFAQQAQEQEAEK